MDKIKTRNVDRNLYINYLKRSEECLNAGKQSFTLNQWNACAITAIHSSIASLDTLCVYFLGQRHAGQNHEDVISLFRSIRQLSNEDIDTISNKISKILKMKNIAEYEERLIKKAEAEKILKDAERLFEFIKNKIPK